MKYIFVGVFVALCIVVILASTIISHHIPKEIVNDDFIYNIDDDEDEYKLSPKNAFNHQMISLGRDQASRSKLLVVSLIRNCENSIPAMSCKLAVLSRIFDEVHVHLFENNSTDGTRRILLSYCGKENRLGGPNVFLTMVNPFTYKYNEAICNTSEQDLVNDQRGGNLEGIGYKRINRMVVLRNRVLEYIYRVQASYDYLLMSDMDIIGRIFPRGIQETVGYLTHFGDMGFISFRGYTNQRTYFDPYSYSSLDGKTLITSVSSMINIPSNQGLYPVGSAHSGGAFANLPLKPGLKYELEKTHLGFYLCEHVTMMRQMKNNFINTNMAYLVLNHG
jgi:hypothetical protein